MKRKYRVLDSWVYGKNEGTPAEVKRLAAQMKDSFSHLPNVDVRSAKRTVKAFNSSTEVTVVVCRQRIDNLTGIGLRASGLPDGSNE